MNPPGLLRATIRRGWQVVIALALGGSPAASTASSDAGMRASIDTLGARRQSSVLFPSAMQPLQVQRQMPGLRFTKSSAWLPGSGSGVAGEGALAFRGFELPGTDGNTLSMVRSGGTLYIAGSFRTVGQNSGGLAAVDADEGRIVPLLPPVAGVVATVISDGAGGWYVGGAFTSVGGVPRKNLAHILADGAVDAEWHPEVDVPEDVYQVDPVVLSLLQSGNRIVLAGDFRLVNGQPRTSLACVDSRTGALLDTNLDLEYYQAGFPGYAHSLTQGDGKIFVGGTFFSVGGQERWSLAAIDSATLVLSDWRFDLYGNVSNVTKVQYRAGALWASGQFTALPPGGDRRDMIAAIDVRSRTLLPFNARPEGLYVDPNDRAYTYVWDFNFVGDTLYVAGNFITIGGQSRRTLAALDSRTGDALDWLPPELGSFGGGPAPVFCGAIVPVGERLYVSGGFVSVNGEARQYIIALDRHSGALLKWEPQLNNGAKLLAVSSGRLILGGGFFLVGESKHRAGLAAIDLSTGQLKPWNPNPNGGVITSIAAYKNRIFVCGDFSVIGGNPEPRRYIAALDTLNGEVLPWQLDMDDAPDRLVRHGEVLYLTGSFRTVNGETRLGLAAVDPTGGELLFWVPSINGAVLATVVKDSTLYLGGIFTTLNGVPRNGAGALDLATGRLTPWNPKPDIPLVESLCDGGDRVFIGGPFDSLGGVPRGSLAAVDRTEGHVLPWHPATGAWRIYGARVNGLAMVDGKLVVGGNFAIMGGRRRICLAAVDTASAFADAWDPSADGVVWSMLADGENLYVGGGFSRVGPVQASGLAAYHVSAAAPPAPEPIVFKSCFPNPATASALLRFDLPNAGRVNMVVYDIQGRVVDTPIENVFMDAGAHGLRVDVRPWRSGIYLCKFTAGGTSLIRKIVVTN